MYLSELKRIGLLNEDGAPTDLGKKWRLDDEYEDVASSILEAAYPASLISIAPVGNALRAMVEKWFMNEGLGSGTANARNARHATERQRANSHQRRNHERADRIDFLLDEEESL